MTTALRFTGLETKLKSEKGMNILKIPTKSAQSHFFNFRAIAIGYLFGRGVAYLISLNMANMNNRKINTKGDLRVILQLDMHSLSFLRNSLRCTQIVMALFSLQNAAFHTV